MRVLNTSLTLAYLQHTTLDKDILHKLGIIFNFENKTILISMKPQNFTAKEFFVIKQSCSVRNTTKSIKQILVVEYRKINLKTIVMILNYLKVIYKDSL